jgi:hypothetical protein
VEEGETPETYPYGITSLADKRDFLQKGDIVNFQVSKVKGSSVLRATALAAQRTYIRAKVDSVKGQVSRNTYIQHFIFQLITNMNSGNFNVVVLFWQFEFGQNHHCHCQCGSVGKNYFVFHVTAMRN